MRHFLFLIGLAFFFSPTAAEELEVRTLAPSEVSPPANINALDWLVGYWEGEGLGGSAREVIAPAVDGQMMGMFHHVKADGVTNFYEFYVFAEVEDTLALRIKHFSRDLVGWETKDDFVEFPLVAVEDEAVYFDGLTYAITDDGTLESAVNVRGRGIIRFKFERAGLE